MTVYNRIFLGEDVNILSFFVDMMVSSKRISPFQPGIFVRSYKDIVIAKYQQITIASQVGIEPGFSILSLGLKIPSF